ncbi:MAG: CotH kinase family protein [Clostridia bacterium]|nr:CotH kinase family protein [Clostridia bacterium]
MKRSLSFLLICATLLSVLLVSCSNNPSISLPGETEFESGTGEEGTTQAETSGTSPGQTGPASGTLEPETNPPEPMPPSRPDATEPILPVYVRASDTVTVNTIDPTSGQAGTPYASAAGRRQYESEPLSGFYLDLEFNPQLPFSVSCFIAQGKVSVLLPAGVDLSRLVAVYDAKGQTLLDEEGTPVESGKTVLNLSRPRTLTLSQSEKAYTVVAETLSTGLPSVCLTTAGFRSISDKINWVDSSFYVGGGDLSVCPYASSENFKTGAQAKGRGNTSWGFPKKGYNIKLESKSSILGLPKHKKYCLISNYQDKSLMRNYLASCLSMAVGMNQTMQVRFVDLWLNGSYHGNYTLIEKIEIDKNSVNIPEYDVGKSPEELGYLLEWDGHVNEVSEERKANWETFGDGIYDPASDAYFVNLDGHWLTFKSPEGEEMEPEMMNYVARKWKKVIAALDSGNEERIRAAIEIESVARWFLVEDLMMNMDASFHSSVYMYLDGQGVFHMGPVWDFDLGAGNANYGTRDTSVAYLENSYIIRKLFKLDFFRDEIYAIWTESYPAVCRSLLELDRVSAMLDLSAMWNFRRWDVLTRIVGANDAWVLNYPTMESQIIYLQAFVRRRMEYIQNLVCGRDYASLASRTSPWKGNGSPDAPYLIESGTDFLRMHAGLHSGNTYEGKYFRQTADLELDFNSTDGKAYTFAGVYDGGGYRIVCRTVGEDACLFPYVSGQIRNLAVWGISIRNNAQAAGLCRSVRPGGVLLNCLVCGEMVSATGSVAGLTSSVHEGAALLNCVVLSELHGNGDVGALTAFVGGTYRQENNYTLSRGSTPGVGDESERPDDLPAAVAKLNRALSGYESEFGLTEGTLCRWTFEDQWPGLVPAEDSQSS